MQLKPIGKFETNWESDWRAIGRQLKPIGMQLECNGMQFECDWIGLGWNNRAIEKGEQLWHFSNAW